MDPTAAWNQMLEHLRLGERYEATENAIALYEWLQGGGFEPRIGDLRRVDFERIARAVIQTCERTT